MYQIKSDTQSEKIYNTKMKIGGCCRDCQYLINKQTREVLKKKLVS